MLNTRSAACTVATPRLKPRPRFFELETHLKTAVVAWLKDLLRNNSTAFKILIAIIIGAKAVLSAATPLGYDFVLYMTAAVGKDQSLSWSPWIVAVANMYSLWLDLPIAHGNAI